MLCSNSNIETSRPKIAVRLNLFYSFLSVFIIFLVPKETWFFFPPMQKAASPLILSESSWINWDFLASVMVNMMHSCLETADKGKSVFAVFRFKKNLYGFICFNLCHFCKRRRLRCQLLPQLRFLSPLPNTFVAWTSAFCSFCPSQP